jgi:hypothetical protein
MQHRRMRKCKLAAEEGILAFRVVKQNISFRSVDCTSEIIKQLYKKCTCSRIKCESIAVNVPVPFVMQHMCKDMDNVRYLSLRMGTSNHRRLKLALVIIG